MDSGGALPSAFWTVAATPRTCVRWPDGILPRCYGATRGRRDAEGQACAPEVLARERAEPRTMNLPPSAARYRVQLNQPVAGESQIEIAGIYIRFDVWTEFQQTDIPFNNLVDLLCDDRFDLDTLCGGA